VADVANDALAQNARGNEAQNGLAPAHDQGVAGIVAALEAHHARDVIGQPVDDLAFAFITPLGAYNDDVLSHAFLEHSPQPRSDAYNLPVAVLQDELPVAAQFSACLLVAGQIDDHHLTGRTQRVDAFAQLCIRHARREDGVRARRLRRQLHPLTQIERKTRCRPRPAEHLAYFIVAAAERNGIGQTAMISREYDAAVIVVAPQI